MRPSITVVSSTSFPSQASLLGSFPQVGVSSDPVSVIRSRSPSYISVATPQAILTPPSSSPVKCHTLSTRVRYSAPREIISSAREKARHILKYQAPEECVVLAFSSGDERTVTKGLLSRHSGLFAELIPQGERREARRKAEAAARSENVRRLRQLAQREKMLAQEHEELRLARQQESLLGLRPSQVPRDILAEAEASAELLIAGREIHLIADELEEARHFSQPDTAAGQIAPQKNHYHAAHVAKEAGAVQNSRPGGVSPLSALASTALGGQSSQQTSVFDMNLDASPGVEGSPADQKDAKSAAGSKAAEDVKPLRLQLECTSEVFDGILAWMHLVDHSPGQHHSSAVALETLRGKDESELLRLSLEADFLEMPALSGQIRAVIGERDHERRVEHEKRWRLRWVEKETEDTPE